LIATGNWKAFFYKLYELRDLSRSIVPMSL